MHNMIDLFFTFLNIGFFTIGGGYVMIPLIKEKFVENKNWLSESEFLDILAIAESSPGPIAINMSTYIGYKKYGLKGALMATFGVVLPSFVCIFIISLFFDNLLSISVVKNAFIGIRIGVSLTIIKVSTKMFVTEYKNSNNKLLILAMFIIIVLSITIAAWCSYTITMIQVLLVVFVIAFVMIKVNKI